MLVLSRKVGERIQIGDNITVVINRVAGNRVTIGIEAPAEMRIVRSELQAALDSSGDDQFPAPQIPIGAGPRIKEEDFLARPLSAFAGRRPR